MELIYKFKNLEIEAEILTISSLMIPTLESEFKTPILIKKGEVKIESLSENEKRVLTDVFFLLELFYDHGLSIQTRELKNMIWALRENKKAELIDLFLNKKVIITTKTGKQIFPRTLNQNEYLKKMNKDALIFGIGPAGTGKTFLAVCYAVSMLKEAFYEKIILTRPVVEAGERLGFLPGDVKEKIDPYLIPLYDTLRECLGEAGFNRALELSKIEIAPLAYMRGRTLDNSIIILDEAQNATKMQMKMFLTRLGSNSKMIITGDTTQVDLLQREYSGLVHAIKILKGIKGLSIVKFSETDVMRHPLVGEIIKRYEEEK